MLITRTKEEKIFLNNYYTLDFLGKRCKNNCHNLCDGEWKGLGFQVFCNCECHDKKKVLGNDVIYHDSRNGKTVISEVNDRGEFNK